MRRAFFTAVFLFSFSPFCLTAQVLSLSPRSTGFFSANFRHMAAGAPSEAVKLPIPFYVIRHSRGVVLFDSGLSLEFPGQVQGWWLHRWFQKILPFTLKEEETAVRRLEKMGIKPEDVKMIVVSHLHYDHSSGLQDFPNAKVVLSKAEWENSRVGRTRALFRGILKEALKGVENRLQLVEYAETTAVPPFEGSYDLMGDGSLMLLSTPGHTPGHQSLLVTLASGKKILLTGDAVWVRENYLESKPKSWIIRHFEEKAGRAWKTTLEIKQFHEEHPEVEIIPGHDPHLWPELPVEFH